MPNHYSTLGISFCPSVTPSHKHGRAHVHTNASPTVSLYSVILIVSHENLKDLEKDHEMIMIRGNLAKYRLMDLKCICDDTFQHVSILHVKFVEQLARV